MQFINDLDLMEGMVGEQRRREEERRLTHVELSDEARHVVVFEVLWQDFLGEASLVKHMKAGPSLKDSR